LLILDQSGAAPNLSLGINDSDQYRQSVNIKSAGHGNPMVPSAPKSGNVLKLKPQVIRQQKTKIQASLNSTQQQIS